MTMEMKAPAAMTITDAYLQECVDLDPLALDEEFVRLPADLALWNERHAQAYKIMLVMKVERDELRATLYTQHRELLTADGGKKPTEATIDAAIQADATWHDMVLKYIDAEVEAMRHKGIFSALLAKRDVLQSLGAKVRAEMGFSPQTREEHSGGRAG